MPNSFFWLDRDVFWHVEHHFPSHAHFFPDAHFVVPTHAHTCYRQDRVLRQTAQSARTMFLPSCTRLIAATVLFQSHALHLQTPTPVAVQRTDSPSWTVWVPNHAAFPLLRPASFWLSPSAPSFAPLPETPTSPVSSATFQTLLLPLGVVPRMFCYPWAFDCEGCPASFSAHLTCLAMLPALSLLPTLSRAHAWLQQRWRSSYWH